MQPIQVKDQKETYSTRFLDGFKETIAVLGPSLDILLKTSPLALLPPSVMIWTYLRRIGWSELFSESLVSTTGLVALFVASILFFLAVLLQFFAPSFFLAFLSSTFYPETRISKISKSLSALCFLPTISWFLIYGVIEMSGAVPLGMKNHEILCPTLVAAGCALGFSVKIRNNTYPWSASVWEKIRKIAAQTFIATVASVASCLPFLVSTWTFEHQPFAYRTPVLAYVTCSIVSSCGLLPGYVALNAQLTHRNTIKTSLLTALVTAATAYVLVGILLVFAPLSPALLKTAGVYSNVPETFQLMKADVAYAARSAGIAVLPVRGSALKDGSPVFIAAGFVRFGFGALKLICREPFQPELVPSSIDSKNQANPVRDAYQAAGEGCIPFKTDDMQVLRRPR